MTCDGVQTLSITACMVLNVTGVGHRGLLQWQSKEGRFYRVQSCPTLGTGYTPLLGEHAPDATGTNSATPSSPSADAEYLQIMLDPQYELENAARG